MPVADNITSMLDLIVCPACRGPLTIAGEEPSITCKACGRRYKIKDGIPVLIVERAIS
ncbi:MAG: Trm112 family protein [Acidobacteria bacterium]|jgi:uncharacterized protein YbaR (Trm112 family)|nr:Trm112 family protein [Acidobacteriota bacterium]